MATRAAAHEFPRGWWFSADSEASQSASIPRFSFMAISDEKHVLSRTVARARRVAMTSRTAIARGAGLLGRVRATAWLAAVLISAMVLLPRLVPSPAVDAVFPNVLIYGSLVSIVVVLTAALLAHGLRRDEFLRTVAEADGLLQPNSTRPTDRRSAADVAFGVFEGAVVVFAALMAALAGIWAVRWLGFLAAIVLYLACAGTLWQLLRADRVAAMVIVGIYLFVFGLDLAVGAFGAVGGGSAALIALFTAYIGFHLLLQSRQTPVRRGSLGEFASGIHTVAQALLRHKLNDRETLPLQGIVVVLAAAVYAVIPALLAALPPTLATFAAEYRRHVDPTLPLLPFLAFFAYCLLLATTSVNVVSNLLSECEDHVTPRDLGVHLLVLAQGVVLLTAPGAVLAAVLYTLADSQLNRLVGLLLGFFVFPQWITRVFAYAIATAFLGLLSSKIRRSHQGQG